MIVIDTSAILSTFLLEDDAVEFAVAIEADDDPMISAATLLETSIVLGAKELVARADADTWLDAFIEKAGISVEAVTIDQNQDRPRRLRRLRTRLGTRRTVEIRGLLLLRAVTAARCGPALQGRRLRADGR